jgi:serine/threonine protein kinase/tetratricopeptide (TPR) repeat protein
LSGARWDRIKDVFDGALQHEPAARADYLRHTCAGDDDLLTEIQSLLAAFEAAGTFIDHPVIESGRLAGEHVDPMTDRRIGPYRILRRAGQGGMADVYLGVRADRLYQRFVAIKLVRTGLDSEEVLRRFRHERQTLAVLDHPNIVKLLDAGTTDAGMPYLVMDFVQGQPVDEYCDTRRLSTAERLELFRTICGAVHYAHQNLVVHRDLKPSNVLVTAEGVPKLLDFGIAKLLRPEYSTDTIGLTRSELRPMTPEYASPEQIRGEPITTASDIYSMGVLLYRLLTGHRPYRVLTHSALEYERAICETAPERPSVVVAQPTETAVEDGAGGQTRPPALLSGTREETPEKLRRKLQGDVDNIVLMAMRKEPQRRYASAAQFSEDIRRHLTGLPVLACKDTVRYRATKFIRRHKAGAVTAALVSVLLVAGVAAIIRSASLAERRFNDVRNLARFVLFKLDDDLQKGATPARRELLGQVLPYLERLEREARDASLEEDLIEGYLKIGDVQFNLDATNLGGAKRAEASYRKARELAQAWNRTDPGDPRSSRELARANQKLGELLSINGDVGEALTLLRTALDKFEELMAGDPGNPRARDDVLTACLTIAAAQRDRGDLDYALRTYQRYVEVVQQSFAAGSQERMRLSANAEVAVGLIEVQRHHTDAGIQRIRGALPVYERLAIHDKADVTDRQTLSATYVNLGKILTDAERPSEAMEFYRSGLGSFEKLSREDPSNQEFLRGRAMTLKYQAEAQSRLGRTQEARQSTADALGLFRTLAEHPDAPARAHREYAWHIVTTPFRDLQDAVAAVSHATKARQMTEASDPAILDTLALAYELNGDPSSAERTELQALALLSDRDSAAHMQEELNENLARFRRQLAKKTAAPR